jgi:hypothetical protein
LSRPPSRRTPDANYKTAAKKFAELAAGIMVADLDWPEDGALRQAHECE